MAIEFNGTTGKIDYGDLAAYGSGNATWSIRALVHANDWNVSQGLVSKFPDAAGADNAYAFSLAIVSSNSIDFLTGDADGDIYGVAYNVESFVPISLDPFTDDIWYDLLVTYNKANGAGARVKFYVNGAAHTQGSGQLVDAGGLDIPNETSSLVLGVDRVSEGSPKWYSGRLADVSMWNTELTSGDAATLYNSGSYKSGLYISTGLVFNARLTNTSTISDEVQSVTPTSAGISDFTHPTVDYPAGAVVIPKVLAAELVAPMGGGFMNG